MTPIDDGGDELLRARRRRGLLAFGSHGLALFLEQIEHGVERQRVAARAEAADGADADRRHERLVAIGLARVHVRQVDLDGGQRHRAQGVGDRHRRMRIRRRVDDDGVRALARRLDVVDQLAFDVGLVALDGGAALPRAAASSERSISASVAAP